MCVLKKNFESLSRKFLPSALNIYFMSDLAIPRSADGLTESKSNVKVSIIGYPIFY